MFKELCLASAQATETFGELFEEDEHGSEEHGDHLNEELDAHGEEGSGEFDAEEDLGTEAGTAQCALFSLGAVFTWRCFRLVWLWLGFSLSPCRSGPETSCLSAKLRRTITFTVRYVTQRFPAAVAMHHMGPVAARHPCDAVSSCVGGPQNVLCSDIFC